MSFSSLITENLDVVFFIYGTAFTFMGATIILQPRRGSVYKLGKILGALAAFALLHGANEYLDMWAIIKGRSLLFDTIRLGFLFTSFLCLFEFGRHLLKISASQFPKAIRSLAENLHWSLAHILAIIAVSLGIVSSDFWVYGSIAARYLLCLPGAILTGLGFVTYYHCQRELSRHAQVKKYFYSTTAAFFIYGLLGGVVVPQADLIPARWINVDSFMALVGLPVQFFRAGSAILATWGVFGILRIFNWEAAGKLEQEIIERKRAEAELKKYNDRLEDLVKDRAKDIIAVNEKLRSEIDERKIIEAEKERLLRIQQKSTQEWQQTFDSAKETICLLSPNLHILNMNKAGYKALNKHPEEVIGHKCYEVVHGMNAPHPNCPCLNSLRTKQAASSEIQERDHSYAVSVSPVFDELNNVSALVHTITDITERKQAELELKSSFDKLKKALSSTIEIVALTVETRDPYTAGHQRRVADLAVAIAKKMRLSEEIIEGVRMAGVIHDIGKISIPAEILAKPGRISEMEMSLVKQHPVVGGDILQTIQFPWPIDKIIRQHHERMDGSGYPEGLRGSEILLEAKIIAVADVVEAMASHRPYRAALGIDIALEEISKNNGILYDPDVVSTCLQLFREDGYHLESAVDVAQGLVRV